jgi:replicative DNA helicase
MDDYDTKVVARIPTGLHDLDAVIGGLPRGGFTLVGARPGIGKSQICKQFALNLARRGIPVGIVTVEEDRRKIGQNYLSNASGVENNHIAYSTMGPHEWDEVLRAVKGLNELPIYIADEPVKLSDVEASIIVMATQKKCEVVIVDYLQLINPDVSGENENREITLISKCLKMAFKRLNIAGIAACQLNRGNETGGVRHPTVKDLRGSGSLDQDGDLIMLLHRDDYYEKDSFKWNKQLLCIVGKNKAGPTGDVPLWFSGKTQTVADWSSTSPFA